MYTHVTGSISTSAPIRIRIVVMVTSNSEPGPKLTDAVGEELRASVSTVGPSGTSPNPLAVILITAPGKNVASTTTTTARIA